MKKNNEKENPWKPEDEMEHPNTKLEWWAVESFFETNEDKKKWSVKAVFTKWYKDKEDNGSLFNITIFDENNKKCYACRLLTKSQKLKIIKDKFDVSYKNCNIKGSYPNYNMVLINEKDDIKLELSFHSESLPRWIAQDITDGWLPAGLGSYRYGFIPKNKVSGVITFKGRKYHLNGTGYFEHIWGDFLYDTPLANIAGLKKTIPIYAKFSLKWLEEHQLKIPNSITVSSENNPSGYDWAWAVLDNGWTIFYGNILFWLMNGPAFGTLILSKDGKNYQEFTNITFNYNKTKRSKNYDFYYPTDFDINAYKGNQHIFLKFKMTCPANEYVSEFEKKGFWKGLVICEAPGLVEGSFNDECKKINLKGYAKIEPQRQVSVLGHNVLKIDIIKPPKGVGISLNLNSNFLNKKIFLIIQLVPKLLFKIKNSR